MKRINRALKPVARMERRVSRAHKINWIYESVFGAASATAMNSQMGAYKPAILCKNCQLVAAPDSGFKYNVQK